MNNTSRKMDIFFEKSNARIKKPKHLKINIFIIYSPRTIKIELATNMRIDTELVIFLPKNSKGFATYIF